MNEEEFHERMAEEWARQRPRPGTSAYKNRNNICSKLSDHLYQEAWFYCRNNGLSFNSLTRILYERFFNSHNG
jgi:hypothetical protein